MTDTESRPKVAISYKWGDEDYNARVLKLAIDLAAAEGIEVVLDKWHLAPGQDANAFMERLVNDTSVTHVLVLCEPRYAASANDRHGGVGTETLIISPEVYRDAKQQKIIPVLMERDDSGVAVLPTYLRDRIYFDLSDPRTEAETFHQLARWLWGKPELVPPPVGPRPAYLDDDHQPLLTGASARQYRDALLRGAPQQHGLLSSYLRHVERAYAAEQIDAANSTAELVEKLDGSLKRFVPYRDEFVELLTDMAEYAYDPRTFDLLHGFFERLVNIRYQVPLGGISWARRTENLAFVGRELYLYAVAVLLGHARFDVLSRIVRPFFVRTGEDAGGALRSPEVLDPEFPTFAGRESPWDDGVLLRLNERATIPGVAYRLLADAEFFLALQTTLVPPDGNDVHGYWWPRGAGESWRVDTLSPSTRLGDPAYREAFVRALRLRDLDDLRTRIERLPEHGRQGPTFWLNRETVARLFRLSAG
jgi:hypothetical protein